MQSEITSRVALFDFLNAQMCKAYKELKTRQRLEFESTLIKTYLLDAHSPACESVSKENDRSAAKLIQTIFSAKKTGVPLEVILGEEEGFYLLVRDEMRAYLDTSTNRRFWVLYTLSSSRRVDTWLDAVVKDECYLDRVWLWPKFLEQVQREWGMPRGFGLDYDFRKIADEPDEEYTTYLKLQLWCGKDTVEVYERLKELFSGKVVLSKVRMKEYSEDRELFAIQDIKYNGKTTARGTDFQTHQSTVMRLREFYEAMIRKLERDVLLDWNKTEKGAELHGMAVNFIPPPSFRIPVVKFCTRALNGSDPFKLLALGDISDDEGDLQVVDYHSGGTMNIQVFPDVIVLYAHRGICANTIVRFYTNLQHCLNAEFEVEGDDGEKVF
jgi:hypothetical protein